MVLLHAIKDIYIDGAKPNIRLQTKDKNNKQIKQTIQIIGEGSNIAIAAPMKKGIPNIPSLNLSVKYCFSLSIFYLEFIINESENFQ